MKKYFAQVLMFILFSFESVKADVSDYDFEPTFHTLRFRVAQTSMIQNSDRYNFSGKVSWSPMLKLDESWALLPSLGMMPALINDQIVPSVELLFYGQYSLNSFIAFELGLGAQNWFSTPSQASPMVSVNFVYRPKHPYFDIFERLIFGYSLVFSSVPTHQVSIGTQFNFDDTF